jgi:NAD(P)-dependent dehydrogenase (short-subunit alcohol dehydrogenase family)
MKDIRGRFAVVTGAGSGIGRATAQALAAAGAIVAVTDLDDARAEETVQTILAAGGAAHAHTLDVASQSMAESVAGDLLRRYGAPAVLVNNAGIGVGGYFLDTSYESWQKVLGVNLLGVVHCCRAFVPAMVGSGEPGQVVNISSMLGYFGARGVSAYCASKFGVLGFSESLRAELVEHGIGVSTICPGIIRTGIIEASILESTTENVEDRRREIDALYARRNYPPEKVAAAVLSAIRRNRAVVPVTLEARATYHVKRWLPGLARWLARRELPV